MINSFFFSLSRIPGKLTLMPSLITASLFFTPRKTPSWAEPASCTDQTHLHSTPGSQQGEYCSSQPPCALQTQAAPELHSTKSSAQLSILCLMKNINEVFEALQQTILLMSAWVWQELPLWVACSSCGSLACHTRQCNWFCQNGNKGGCGDLRAPNSLGHTTFFWGPEAPQPASPSVTSASCMLMDEWGGRSDERSRTLLHRPAWFCTQKSPWKILSGYHSNDI